MIENIKLLKGYKGISEDIKLEGLGRINIICGKNNSGKSTIMEAIADEKKNSVGIELSKGNLLRLTHLYHSTKGGESSDIAGILNDSKKIFQDTYKTEIVYHDISVEFWECMILAFEKKNRAYFTLDDVCDNRHYYNEAFSSEYIKSVFPQPSNPILINPKRKIESLCDIKPESEVSANGMGLINKLFYLKNQNFKSDHFQRYRKIHKAFTKITGYYFNIVIGSDKKKEKVADNKTESKLYLKFSKEKVADNKTESKLYLKFSMEPSNSKRWLNAKKCGLGLRDILIMLYFINDKEHDTILIEEPENHIHPDMQRKLLEYIKNESNKQFFLSTHSNIFLNPNYVNKIVYTEIKNNCVTVDDTTGRVKILEELGYSLADNICPDCVILHEGISDKKVIEVILKKIDPELLIKYKITFLSLGGDSMHYFDIDRLCENFTPNIIVALIDGDYKSKYIREEFKKNCKDENGNCKINKVYQLQRYAIENYVTLEALINYYTKDNPELAEKIKSLEELNPTKKLESQIYFSDENVDFENLRIETSDAIKNINAETLEYDDFVNFCDVLKALNNKYKPKCGINCDKLKKNLNKLFDLIDIKKDLEGTDLLKFCEDVISILENRNGSLSTAS